MRYALFALATGLLAGVSPSLWAQNNAEAFPDDLTVHDGQAPEDPLASETLIPKPRSAELHDSLLQTTLALEPSANERRIVITTGPSRGGYYGVGGVICGLLNQSYARHRIECLVRPSTGSRENLVLLRRGQADLAIIQSDMLAYAARGDLDVLAEGEQFDRLRALASLYPIPAHVVVRRDSGIERAADLRGARLALGPEGTAQRAIAGAILTQAGVNLRSLERVDEAQHADPVGAICNAQVEGLVLVSPVPHPSLQVAMARCDVRLIALESQSLTAMVEANPFFVAIDIEAGTYSGQDRSIPTIGFAAVLAVRDDLELRVAAEVLNAIASNFAAYQQAYPALNQATPECLDRCGLAVPLHDAVTEYATGVGQEFFPEPVLTEGEEDYSG